jgi:hypothetical protein
VYPIVLIDAIVLKIRDGQVRNRPVYVAMGISVDGERDVLGLWAAPGGGGEGAKQWMTMLTELRNRGVADVCIVCCDGLKGLPDAIAATWPLATVQTCVVHLVRSSLRYASKADWAKIAAGLKDGLHRSDSRDGRAALRCVRGDLARQVSGDDRHVGAQLARVRAVPGLPSLSQNRACRSAGVGAGLRDHGAWPSLIVRCCVISRCCCPWICGSGCRLIIWSGSCSTLSMFWTSGISSSLVTAAVPALPGTTRGCCWAC